MRIIGLILTLILLFGITSVVLSATGPAFPGAEVAVLAKASMGETNTTRARGGIAAVLHSSDSFEQHVSDTLSVGCGLSDRDCVEQVVRAGPTALNGLLDIGAEFDRTSAG